MENANNTNATVNNATVATTEVGDTSRQQQPRRSRERFHTQLSNFSELDPKQFPSKPREERVPMWAQQLQKSVDLLSQEQQKLADKLNAMDAAKAGELKPDVVAEAAKVIEAVNGLKKLSEENFNKIRENQKHSYDHTMGAMKDLMMSLSDFIAKQEPQKAARSLFWYIFNPKTALKEWWQRKTAERRQRKAEKLEAQLKALRGAK